MRVPSRSRTGRQQVLGHFESGYGLLAGDGRKMVEESVQTVASGEVVQQVPPPDNFGEVPLDLTGSNARNFVDTHANRLVKFPA